MSKMNHRIGSAAILLAIFCAGVFLSDVVLGTAAADQAHRYPFDPVCAWGRVANGNGMLVRCLVEGESAELSGGKDTGAGAPPQPAHGPEQSPPTESPKLQKQVVAATLGPLAVDTGTLPHAVRKLDAAKDRFVECVETNGGVTSDKAEVVVRFLVRERGRAEGVSVKDRRGVSRDAGKCIAEVVDRRHVGYPAAPIVGATLTISFAVK